MRCKASAESHAQLRRELWLTTSWTAWTTAWPGSSALLSSAGQALKCSGTILSTSCVYECRVIKSMLDEAAHASMALW